MLANRLIGRMNIRFSPAHPRKHIPRTASVLGCAHHWRRVLSVRELNHLHIELSGMNLIEASAGTGKTYAIACLYLRLLIELKLPPERILVVTYTEAATKELRGADSRPDQGGTDFSGAGGGGETPFSPAWEKNCPPAQMA